MWLVDTTIHDYIYIWYGYLYIISNCIGEFIAISFFDSNHELYHQTTTVLQSSIGFALSKTMATTVV